MFERFFRKKPKDKDIIRFWTDFENRSGLYLDILRNDDEDSDDYMWMMTAVNKALRLCCLDAKTPYSFTFNGSRDPIMFVFHHSKDEYLMQVADKLKEYYPSALNGVIDFRTEE